MDGRAQLLTLARAIDGAAQVDAAWAGTGPVVDLRKTCGVCGEDQPVRVPFLRHVCRSCQAIWVPGICGDCAHTCVTFTLDGQLSAFAGCGCGGRLRQLGFVPRPRVAVDPEVAKARREVVERRTRQGTRAWRVLLVALAVTALVLGVRTVTGNHRGEPVAPAPTRQAPAVLDGASQSLAAQGRLAALRLRQAGQVNDVFGCAGQLPASALSKAADPADAKAFLAGCVAG